jgi:hypothetical protein
MTDITKMSGPVDRSFEGLRDALFDALDGIRSDTIDLKKVDGIAKISAQISKAVDVELKVFKLGQQVPHAQPKNEQQTVFKLSGRKG